MKIRDILKNFILQQGISQSEFARRANLSKVYIGTLLKGKNNLGNPCTPTAETLRQLAAAMNMNFDDFFALLDDDQAIIFNSEKKSLMTPFAGLSRARRRKYPLLGEVACGSPIECVREYEMFESDVDAAATYVLRAKGDSMINARIFDGDIVFIREQPEVENGEIAAIVIDGKITLKRFYKHDDCIELRAENPTFKSIVIRNSEFDSIRVIGKAVACQFHLL